MNQQINAPDPRRYFTMVPNLIDDSDLDPYQFRLLLHYYRVGTCWESVRTTAQKCHMSVGKVSEVRRELAKLGWIVLQEKDDGVIIDVVDKWRENAERCSPHEQGVHDMNGGVHHVNQRITNEEYINNAVREESAWQQLHAAVAKAMRRSPFMMTEEENGAVDRLYASGYTAEQIERYYGAGGYWRTRDWRGTKNQPLTVGALEETIGTCQDFEEHPEDYAAATTRPKVSNGEVDSAFEKLTRLASGYGARRFKDALPELRENGLVPVVEKLGWREICLTPRDKLIWQFRSAYRDAVPA